MKSMGTYFDRETYSVSEIERRQREGTTVLQQVRREREIEKENREKLISARDKQKKQIIAIASDIINDGTSSKIDKLQACKILVELL